MKRYLILLVGLFVQYSDAQKAYNIEADSLYQIGNYAAAINSYSKIGSTNSSLQIARCYNAIGNFDKAIIQYESLVKEENQNVIAAFELGKLFFKTKKYEQAKTVFYDLVEHNNNNNNPEYSYYLARSYQNLKETELSINSFKNALKIDSTHLKSLYALGKYYVGLSKKKKALNYIDKGLRFYENDVSLINLKALALYKNAEFLDAIPHFEKLLKLGENKPFIIKKLAYCYYESWNLDKAKETYLKLKDNANYESDAYFGLGEVYMKLKHLDSAKVYFKKSIEAKRVLFDLEYAKMGRIERIRNNLKDAMSYYLKAYEEDKSNYHYYYQVCVLADEYYKDPELKITYYKNFLTSFEKLPPYFEEIATKRISELKEEIHFAKK